MPASTHDDREVSIDRTHPPVAECECIHCGLYSPAGEVPESDCPDAPGAGNWEHEWKKIAVTDGGWITDRRPTSEPRNGPAISGISLVECPDCGRKNDPFVNPRRCYNCGHRWGASA